MDYEQPLLDMLQNQIVARGINDPRILDAMQRVPRHWFVPEEYASEAYADRPIVLPEDRATISQPYMVAYMTEQLQCSPNDKVLEIGTGSGYQAAILAHLCKEVYTLERHYTLSVNAQRSILALSINNVYTRVGDHLRAFEDAAPFDKIVVTAASRKVPNALVDQLAPDGKLLIPLGDSLMQTLTLFTKMGDELQEKQLIPCVFVPIITKSHDYTKMDNPDILNPPQT